MQPLRGVLSNRHTSRLAVCHVSSSQFDTGCHVQKCKQHACVGAQDTCSSILPPCAVNGQEAKKVMNDCILCRAAHEYLERGHAKGKVVLTVSS